MFRKPNRKEFFYLVLVGIFYLSGLIFVYVNDLSFSSLYKYGLLQPKGITGAEERTAEIDTPLSLNLPKVLWYIYIKGSAVLVELFQYWVIGMLIAASLIIFVPWEKLKRRMGYGGIASNFIAAFSGSIIPICSCGIVPVLAGMVEAGIPLGPTMAFLIAAPMLNVPAVFMTAGILGWKLAIGRIIGTFAIAFTVGQILTYVQKKDRFLRRLVKINATPSLSKEMQQFAFEIGKKLILNKEGLLTEELSPGNEEKLYILGEAGILDRKKDGRWFIPTEETKAELTGGCFVLPANENSETFKTKMKKLLSTGWDLFIQLNYYLILAVLIAGAIKVIIPTKLIIQFVGENNLNSVLIASIVAVLAYVCTYVEVPTALALIQKGMSEGATLSYLLGGPGLSLPSIAMLSGIFKPKVLWIYVVVSFFGCVVAGYLLNIL